MRRFLWAGLVLLVTGVGGAQDASQLAKLAGLYSIDLARGDWQHEDSPVCPAFTHHSFVSYRRTPQPGVRTSFLVVSSSVPGSSTRLVPWAGELPMGADGVRSKGLEQATIAQFNAVWREELAANGGGPVYNALTWAGLAECFARFAGQRPVALPEIPSTPDAPPPVDLRQPAQAVVVAVAGQGPEPRSLEVGFDHRGFIQSAQLGDVAVVTVSKPNRHEPVWVPVPKK